MWRYFYNMECSIIKKYGVTKLGSRPACQTLCVWVLLEGCKDVRINTFAGHTLIVILRCVNLSIGLY